MTSDMPRLLKAAEVAALFRVHRATVARWKGLTVIRTPGGDRRYSEAEVLAYLNFGSAPMTSLSGVGGDSTPEREHERPAASAVLSPPLQTAGRQEGAGAPGELGGSTGRAPAFPPNPPSREGGR